MNRLTGMSMLPAGVGSPIAKTLQDIIDYARELKFKAESYSEIFEKSYPDINAFVTIKNDMIMLNEQLHYYGHFWCKIQKRKTLEIEHSQRIDRILTWTYIHSFGVVEFITKELIKKKNSRTFGEVKNKLNKGLLVNFKQIIEKSKKEKIINEYEKAVWDILREIRNAIVHNNAFFTKNKQLTYTLGKRVINLEYKRNEHLKGDLDLTIILIEILMEIYYNWVKNFLKMN